MSNPFTQAIESIIEVLQRKSEVKPGLAAVSPWEAMIIHEAGPNRSKPLHGFAPFNPAERRIEDIT